MQDSQFFNDIAANRVFQRRNGRADIATSGNCAELPHDIQARLWSGSTLVRDWAVLDGLTINADGHWTGHVVQISAGGPYRLDVRSRDETGEVLQSASETNPWHVGDIFLIGGDENARQLATAGSIATNIFAVPEAFDSMSWTKANMTVSADAAIAPDGTMTAERLAENGVSGLHLVQQFISCTAGLRYCYSVHARAGERGWLEMAMPSAAFGSCRAYVNLATGAVGATSGAPTIAVEDAGNGWRRVTMKAVAQASAGGNFAILLAKGDGANNYTGDGQSGLFLWGARLVQADEDPIYLPVTPHGFAFDGTGWAAGGSSGSGQIVLANMLAADDGAPVAIINAGVDGSTAAQWSDVASAVYGNAAALITAAGGAIAGVILQMGGNDAASFAVGDGDVHLQRWRGVIAQFRTDTNSGDLPVFIIGCPRNEEAPIESDAHFQNARAVEMKVAADDNVYLAASTIDLPLADGKRLGVAAAITMARRVAGAVIAARNGASEWRGPEIAGINAVDEMTTELELRHRNGAGFTPLDGITGFELSGDGFGNIAPISTAEAISSTIIRLRHAAVQDVRAVRYQYGRNPPVDAAVHDDSTALLPLEMTPQWLVSATALTAHDLCITAFQDAPLLSAGPTRIYSSRQRLNIAADDHVMPVGPV